MRVEAMVHLSSPAPPAVENNPVLQQIRRIVPVAVPDEGIEVVVEAPPLPNQVGPAQQQPIDVEAERLILLNEIELQRRRQNLPPTYLMAAERVLRDVVPASYLGPFTRMCQFCNALHFRAELNVRGFYVKCCSKGNVVLPPLRAMPEPFRSLFNDTHVRSRHFKQNILRYNYAFQFVSLEANLRDLPAGRAPPVYCIQGKMYHHISNVNANAPIQRYGPIYFLTPDQAVDQRADNNEDLDRDLIRTLEQTLRDVNVYAQSYMHLRERYELELEIVERLRQDALRHNLDPPVEIPVVTLELLTVRGFNNRPYDLPAVDEVAAVYRVNVDTPPTPNLRIYVRNEPGRLQNVDYKSEIVDPMVFPLLFPMADPGWHIHMQHANDQRRLTVCEYYAHRLAVRDADSRFLWGRKLTQQYVVAAYIKIESNRLEFILRNQERLRADLYVGLADFLQRQLLQNDDDEEAGALGRMVILPSTFVGSPRALHQNFQDAMAVVKRYGPPSLFITVTCNPKWREIVDNIPAGHQASDHPMLTARVFQCKFDEVLKDLLECHIFGVHLANLAVIEFQKRGLPHTHILIILRNEDKVTDVAKIDQFISAEIPDVTVEPELYEIVTRQMVHNPCGDLNPNAVCMVDGKCSKSFPKPFAADTMVSENGTVTYRRPNNGRTVTVTRNGREHVLDNRWIVPHNPFLLLKYDCHINVEAGINTGTVKYLYKYFFKGADFALVRVNAQYPNQANHNEVESFLNGRYMSPPEASWHILQNPMMKNTHAVYRLCVHLPERQRVQFIPGFEREAVQRNEVTQLTAWFTLNQTDADANQYLYTDIPLHYVWRANLKRWTLRQRGADKIIVRMYSVNFRQLELYYLRLLLLHVKGARSYEDVRTVDGIVCDTFHAACQLRGLLADDVEWRRALREASFRDMPFQLRNMFAYMLIFCEISDKVALWEEFREFFVEDFIRQGVHQEIAVERTLIAIQSVLNVHGHRLSDFGLPEPVFDDIQVDPIDREAERLEGDQLRRQLNPEQAVAFDAILDAVRDEHHPDRLFFINAAAGTGKSFIFRTLISVLLGEDETVVPLAPTGLAASLLKGGRTIHSRFKLPLDINETTTCGVSPNSVAGNLLRSAKLFIIDEISMVTRTILKIIDRGLQDICNDNRPFGNKVIVLGGDFRQMLPVVVGGNRATIVDVCVKSNLRWPQFTQLNLLNNVRAGARQLEFAQWLLNLGNDTLPALRRTHYGNLIEIPPDCLVDTREELERFCFENVDVAGEIPNAAILTPLNATCWDINDSILGRLPGRQKIYVSADSVDTTDDPVAEIANYPVEFLNSLTPSGFPNHRLLLKVGAIVVLLRNLNLRQGLCNGTRLIVRSLGDRYIEAEKLDNSGRPGGDVTFIPRIDLISANGTLPFKLRRRQFPIKLAYCLTCHKSQGQTFDRVGIHLPQPVFAHGQLYVAFSRAKSFQGVKVFIEDSHLQGKLLPNDPRVYTRNIVYPEIL